MTSEDRLSSLHWTEQPAPPKRRRRWPYRLAITVLVVVGLFVGADRIAVGVVESSIASRVQSSQGLATKPSVAIDGFPFLTQLAHMRLDKATLDMRDVVRNGVHVTDLQAVATGITLSNGFKSAVAHQVVATAFVSWTDLQAAAADQGFAVTVGEGGDGPDQLAVAGDLPGIGQVKVVSEIVVGPDNRISAKALKVTAGGLKFDGAIPTALDFTIPVGKLPMGMILRDIRVATDGIRVTGGATDVSLTSSGVGGAGGTGR